MLRFVFPATRLLAIAALGFAGCAAPPAGELPEAELNALKDKHAHIMEGPHADPSAADWKKFAEEHYAPDAIVMPPNGPAIEGMEAIVNYSGEMASITRFKTSDVEVSGSGNMAYLRGTYEVEFPVNDSTTVTDRGKYIEIWRKGADGNWLCTRDIYNSDLPAQP